MSKTEMIDRWMTRMNKLVAKWLDIPEESVNVSCIIHNGPMEPKDVFRVHGMMAGAGGKLRETEKHMWVTLGRITQFLQ